MEQTRASRQKAARRQRILKVALEAFLETGYADTSMATIAARVGGSKGTLYNHVKTKEELFLACIEDFVATHSKQALSTIDSGGRVEDVLIRFCRFFLTVITSKTDIALNRLVIAEADRFPAIGSAFFTSVPGLGIQRLADYLEDAMARGELRRENPIRAARILLGLCQSGTYQEVLFNVAPSPGPRQIATETKAVVEAFMRLYGVS
ncbi:MAG: TetR/AcrR family transcriptional regulator [Porticoccaceae bacterium]|jgi:AcrR family transcriptional regulator